MQGVASGSWPALAGAPTIGTATAGALSASVAFTAPAYVGSGITGYTATSSPGGFTGTGASSPVTVSGLTAGTAYTFTVTATTAAGQGSASAASNSVTPTLPTYIEDVFSTWLYTGNGSTQTITNGIDLSGKGGLVWAKIRDQAYYHGLSGPDFATSYFGGYGGLRSNQTAGLGGTDFTGVTSTGFTLGSLGGDMNFTGGSYASWTFRKQPKFFDVVTYTGTGADRTIAHSLGSVPGCIIVKRTDTTGAWQVYHSSLANTQYLVLNTTAAVATGATRWNSTTPTSTVFSVGTDATVNASGGTYVAYLFAHDAGGFGLTGTDNVISCGSFTTDGSGNATISLGYEPQWLLVKETATAGGGWQMFDNMRGLPAGTPSASAPYSAMLFANLSNAEQNGTMKINSTGLAYSGWVSEPYIYIAIRRGPMAVPTLGTSVFSPLARTGTGATATVTGLGFTPDLAISELRTIAGFATPPSIIDRLRGASLWLPTSDTAAEASSTALLNSFASMDGYTLGAGTSSAGWNRSANSYINWNFKRAPSFFDEVCYTGNGVTRDINHNLGVTPEFYIVKQRSGGTSTTGWATGGTVYPNSTDYYTPLLNSNQASIQVPNAWRTPTSTTFGIGTAYPADNTWNYSGATYVAYLFATCPGVSKVGTYTGNGTTQTINCGFGAGGARFVLIKKTSATGDWYVYDTARGMTTLTDPYLFLNDQYTGETATLGSVTTVATGFALNSAILADINVSAATYIFLAIA